MGCSHLEIVLLLFSPRTYTSATSIVSSYAPFTLVQPIMPQVCIYPKEVAQLTGAKYSTAKVLLQRIRAEYGKPPRAYVSVAEFCRYTHLSEAEVSRALNRS